MYNRFLELPEEERRNVFQAVSASMGLRSDIVEKDYSHVWNGIFEKPKTGKNIT